MDAGGIDPAVVKIEQGADGDGVIDGLVVPAGGVKRLHVAGRNLRRVAVHLVDEAQKHFFFFTEAGDFKITKDRLYELLATVRATFLLQKYRRDRGVRFQSKGTIIASRSIGRNEFGSPGVSGEGSRIISCVKRAR